MSWLDKMAAMLGMAEMTEPKILKFKDSNTTPLLCDWVSFPWGDTDAVKALSQSEYGMEYIGELIYLSNRLSKVNKMSEMPGKTRLPGRMKWPERFWAEKPVSEKDWKSGKIGLRLNFSESPRTNIVIANKSDRTIRVGSRREVHLGSVEASFNLSQRYIATEELAHYHLAQTVYHYACKKPINWDQKGKVKDAFSNTDPAEHTTDYKHAIEVFGETEMPDEGCSSPDKPNRDVSRSDKFPTQVWNRYEGVVRWEAVDTEENSSGGSYGHDLQGYTDKTPVFKDDSPEALFEIRPAEFNVGDHAAIIMATPTYVLCGMSNPGTEDYSLNKTAGKWSAKTEDSSGDNFFAVRNKKNITENWKKTQPKEDAVTPDTADFGIIGGNGCVYSLADGGEKPGDQKTGMELFGSNVVSIGAGWKNEHRWTSGLVLGTKVVELRHSKENDDNGESLISMKSELLELRNKVASLESMIRMDKDGITLQVGDNTATATKIRIGKDLIDFYINGKYIAQFNSSGLTSKQTNKVSL